MNSLSCLFVNLLNKLNYEAMADYIVAALTFYTIDYNLNYKNEVSFLFWVFSKVAEFSQNVLIYI